MDFTNFNSDQLATENNKSLLVLQRLVARILYTRLQRKGHQESQECGLPNFGLSSGMK